MASAVFPLRLNAAAKRNWPSVPEDTVLDCCAPFLCFFAIDAQNEQKIIIYAERLC
jgi:hypothetical protein